MLRLVKDSICEVSAKDAVWREIVRFLKRYMDPTAPVLDLGVVLLGLWWSIAEDWLAFFFPDAALLEVVSTVMMHAVSGRGRD